MLRNLYKKIKSKLPSIGKNINKGLSALKKITPEVCKYV